MEEERNKGRLGIWVKPRQPLPSKRDAHSQQWSLGVAMLYVVHDCLQIFSIAGTKGPVGLRQTGSLDREGGPCQKAEQWKGNGGRIGKWSPRAKDLSREWVEGLRKGYSPRELPLGSPGY